MKKIKAGISPFNRFPDHIILHILNKLIDLKILCTCKLVSKRFNRIICQVDTVLFTANEPDNDTCSVLRSLGIESPSVPCNEYVETRSLFKISNNRVRSFLFLSPNAIYGKNGLSYRNGNQEDEERNNFLAKKAVISFECLLDTFARFRMLLLCITGFPSLENISFTDLSKQRMFSVCGRKIVQARDWLDSSSETIEQRIGHCSDKPFKDSRCFIPSLELPVSGYVMKGVSAVLLEWDDLPDGDGAAGDDSFINGFGDDDYGGEDKQKAAAYGEAMTEVLKNLKG